MNLVIRHHPIHKDVLKTTIKSLVNDKLCSKLVRLQWRVILAPRHSAKRHAPKQQKKCSRFSYWVSLYSFFILNVVVLIFIILSVVLLSVVLLSVVLLSVVILIFIILSVVILIFIILRVIILIFIILSFVILSVIILSLIILSVFILMFIILSDVLQSVGYTECRGAVMLQ